MARSRKATLDRLPAAALSCILSWLDPVTALSMELVCKKIKTLMRSNKTIYKKICDRDLDIDGLPSHFKPKEAVLFLLRNTTGSRFHDNRCPEEGCYQAAWPRVLYKTYKCLACLTATQQVLAYAEALERMKFMTHVDDEVARSLLEITPNELNPSCRQWRLDRCLFATFHIDPVATAFNTKALPVREFVKEREGPFVFRAKMDKFQKMALAGGFRASCNKLIEKAVAAEKLRQVHLVFNKMHFLETLRPYVPKIVEAFHRDLAPQYKQSGESSALRKQFDTLLQNAKRHARAEVRKQALLAKTFKELSEPSIEVFTVIRNRIEEQLRASSFVPEDYLTGYGQRELLSICVVRLLDQMANRWPSEHGCGMTDNLEASLKTIHETIAQLPGVPSFEKNAFQIRCDAHEECRASFQVLTSFETVAKHWKPKIAMCDLRYEPILDADSPMVVAAEEASFCLGYL